MGSYARFKHYLTSLEVETCPEFWPPSPVSGPLCRLPFPPRVVAVACRLPRVVESIGLVGFEDRAKNRQGRDRPGLGGTLLV